MPFGFLAEKVPDEAWSPIMAFILSTLRILGEVENGKVTWGRMYRIVIEGLTCASIAVGIIPLVEHFNLSPNFNILVGVFVGYAGTQTVRLAAISFLNRKIGK